MNSGISIVDVDDATVLRRPGTDSAQILWPDNAPNAQMTVTRVTMQPGAISPPHVHVNSEQVWIVEKGAATLLLGEGGTVLITAGQVVRTPPGESHGIENTGSEVFGYLSITTPPENFTTHYSETVAPPT